MKYNNIKTCLMIYKSVGISELKLSDEIEILSD